MGNTIIRKKLCIAFISLVTFTLVGIGIIYGLAERRQCIWKRLSNQEISSNLNANCYQNPVTGICVLIQKDSKTSINSAGVIRRNGWHIVNLSFWVFGDTAILYSANDDFASLKADTEWITPMEFLEVPEGSGYRYTVDEKVRDKKEMPLHLSFWTRIQIPEN